jgi:hypothetical protein
MAQTTANWRLGLLAFRLLNEITSNIFLSQRILTFIAWLSRESYCLYILLRVASLQIMTVLNFPMTDAIKIFEIASRISNPESVSSLAVELRAVI